MKKTTKIALGIVCSIVLVVAVVISGFSIYSNYENDKLQAYLADTSNPPKALKNPDEWVETFHDDFNTFDTTKWKSLTFKEWGNSRRAAYYTGDEESIFAKDGNLYLRTEWKDGKYGKGWYSAYIVSSKSNYINYNTADFEGFNQNEGYFEIRCKVPPTKGIWSAFWLMPDTTTAFGKDDIQGSIEDGLEVDILESINYAWLEPKKKYAIQNVLHTDGFSDNHRKVASDFFYVPNLYSEFHTFGVLWEGASFTFFIDGIQTWSTEFIVDGKNFGTCNVNEYMILSTEIIGYKENDKLYEGRKLQKSAGLFEKFDAFNISPKRNSKNKPHDFIVDYVRVYKRK